MNDSPLPYTERLLAKTKIVATVGPRSNSVEQIRQLATAGVDIFRLNFAHGDHDEMINIVDGIRRVSDELDRPLGILGDLAGPKIRLGKLPHQGLLLEQGQSLSFHRHADPENPTSLSSTYERLIDDLKVGDRLLLADGSVTMRVVEKEQDLAECVVVQPGLLRSRQGINLPGVNLRLPSLTEKDHHDLAWAMEQKLDFIGLSFVRSSNDIQELRRQIVLHPSEWSPWIVAKIEKPEALDNLEDIVAETDAVMVARGDLGVEVDIVRVPMLQKRIINTCNRYRVPVITATQMLDSMQQVDRPTRAEASDVLNSVLDGSDALMLSGETAIGRYPIESVIIMSRIAGEAEQHVQSIKDLPLGLRSRNLATQTTRALTLGAIHAAEQLSAKLIVVLTRSGATAIAVSELRSPIPILALTDDAIAARRMCLAWGVTPVVTNVCQAAPHTLIDFVVNWGRERCILEAGDRLVLVGTTDWSQVGKDLMLVHVVD